MIRTFKKGLACALVAALTFAAAAPVTADAAVSSTTTAPAPSKQHDVVAEKQSNGLVSEVTTNSYGQARITSVKKTNKTSVTIASKIEVNGVKYTVQTIGAKAFVNCKKATKVTLPATITKINKSAFTGAKKLKTIVLKNNKVLVKKGAFKGLKTSKMTIKVKKMSAKELKAFKKALKKAGFKGKVKMF